MPKRPHHKVKGHSNVGRSHRGDSMTVCESCGASPLQWRNTNNGWRLFDNAQPHVCSAINDFEVLDA